MERNPFSELKNVKSRSYHSLFKFSFGKNFELLWRRQKSSLVLGFLTPALLILVVLDFLDLGQKRDLAVK